MKLAVKIEVELGGNNEVMDGDYELIKMLIMSDEDGMKGRN